jgi:hypothetical protein
MIEHVVRQGELTVSSQMMVEVHLIKSLKLFYNLTKNEADLYVSGL